MRNLGGRITGSEVEAHARTDLDNIGGVIDAAKRLSITADRDLNIASTTSTSTYDQGRNTSLDRIAGLYLTGPGGSLTATAGRDANFTAAEIVNRGAGGQTSLGAGRDLTLGSVTESRDHTLVWNANNWRHDASSQDIGTRIDTAGDITLSAGQDLKARAAEVTSEQGAIRVHAERDIKLEAGQASQGYDEAHQVKKNGTFSDKTTTTRDGAEQTTAVASTFSGETVNLSAKCNIGVSGSNVVSTSSTTVDAGCNVSIEAATNTHSEHHFKDTRQSGAFSSGGGITVGKQREASDSRTSSTSAAASTIGATAGNVTIHAGNTYTQTGSDVLTPQGDIDITAKRVQIEHATETTQGQYEQQFRQSGLSITASNTLISAAQNVGQMGQAGGNTDDPRMKALAAASAALIAKDTAQAIANDPSSATSVGINLNLGSSKSRYSSEQSSTTVRGSTVTAGGNITIRAEGAGQDSDLTVQGSQVRADGTVKLKAEGDIELLAGQNTAEQHSTQSSQSGSVGIGIGADAEGYGVRFNASASRSRGQADGTDVAWTTHASAGQA